MVAATDDAIRSALAAAELPCLLSTLAFATGDLSLLKPHLQVDPLLAGEPQGGLTEAQQAEIREIAFGVIRDLQNGTRKVAPAPDADTLHTIMEYLMAAEVSEDYLPLLEEELAITSDDPRAPDWKKAELAGDRKFTVAIIGAGMSGLLNAYRLQQAGVPFVIFDKNDEVGGTWYENQYPGCRVDVPNHFYSYSFENRHAWPLHYSPQAVLLEYFREFAEFHGLRKHIRFNHEVSSMVWDEQQQAWVIELKTPTGETTETVQAVISAVGQLNRPKMPDIEGMHSFAGPSFHSAEWDKSVDLTGKRVVIIGSGASSAQICPIVAQTAKHLTVFQRTPNWFFPFANYHDEIAPGLQWMFDNVPSYRKWYRFLLFWRGAEGVLPACKVDPNWPDKRLAVSQLNLELRTLLEDYLKAEFADRPDLAEKVIPQYPPASKRIMVDNGTWAKTLKRDNVSLNTVPIERITEKGVLTTDGVLHEADVIVYATGFHAHRFLNPMKIVGRGGVELHEKWDGNASAYLGITMPGFPNFFFMYGPNTNIVVNGSIIWFSEREANYIVDAIGTILRNKLGSIDCKQEVHDRYKDWVDAGNKLMVWGISTVNSWYKSPSGRVAQNWPYSLLEFWQQTRATNLDDYATT